MEGGDDDQGKIQMVFERKGKKGEQCEFLHTIGNEEWKCGACERVVFKQNKHCTCGTSKVEQDSREAGSEKERGPGRQAQVQINKQTERANYLGRTGRTKEAKRKI